MRIALLLVCAGCTGVIALPKDPSSLPSGPGPSPLNLLTNREYDNTVRDLLGDTTQPARQFPPDEVAFGFDNNADARSVSDLLAQRHLDAAEALATNAVQNLVAFVGCDPASGDACVRAFIARFGARAWRRPLGDGEVGDLFAFYKHAGDAATGVRLLVEGFLLAPDFLYRVELGDGGGAVIPLGQYERASRLSYFLWGTMPDDALFAAAAAGQLASKDQIAAQARRMLGDARAQATVINFHEQWLELNHGDLYQKDASVYPEYTAAIAPLVRQESDEFVRRVVFDGPGDLTTLLTASFSYMNGALAAFYGVAGPSGNDFARVDLDPARRAGLLTQSAWLVTHGKPNQSDPVHRGKFVRTKMLCMDLPPPPVGLNIMPPPLDPTQTTRQRFAAHTSNPACAGCHKMIDPIGLGFERYDGVGRWRDSEAGQPIDASGSTQPSDLPDHFGDAIELAHQLAASKRVHDCVTRQWFRYAYGRHETGEDAQTLADLSQTFSDSRFDVRALMVALTQTDAFLSRHAIVAGGAP